MVDSMTPTTVPTTPLELGQLIEDTGRALTTHDIDPDQAIALVVKGARTALDQLWSDAVASRALASWKTAVTRYQRAYGQPTHSPGTQYPRNFLAPGRSRRREPLHIDLTRGA